MDEENVSPEYIKRVNDGYLLAKHIPGLAAQLKDAAKDREDGLAAGIRQAEMEKQKATYPKWMGKDRLADLDKDNDQERDIDKDDLGLEHE